MIQPNYTVGDKVVCVDDKLPPQASKYLSELPVKGRTYCVRDMLFISGFGWGVWVVGITGLFSEWWQCEHGLVASRFVKPEKRSVVAVAEMVSSI